MIKKPLFTSAVNIPAKICTHFIGEQHTQAHRFAVGITICISGVALTHAGAHCALYVTLITDLIGWMLHGVGSVPFVDYFINSVKENNDAKDTTKN